jgi:hypothetical protein
MRLPNGDHAFIAPSKLAGYLLSGTHPTGQLKAKFFRAVGFDETTLSVLQAGLLIIAKECEVTQVSSSPHGMKYISMVHCRHLQATWCQSAPYGLLTQDSIHPDSWLPIPGNGAKEGKFMEELDLVVLTHDIPEHGLLQGDLGTIVHCYTDGQAWEVEFVTVEGRTVAVLTLTRADIRPMGSHEILPVRELSQTAV